MSDKDDKGRGSPLARMWARYDTAAVAVVKEVAGYLVVALALGGLAWLNLWVWGAVADLWRGLAGG